MNSSSRSTAVALRASWDTFLRGRSRHYERGYLGRFDSALVMPTCCDPRRSRSSGATAIMQGFCLCGVVSGGDWAPGCEWFVLVCWLGTSRVCLAHWGFLDDEGTTVVEATAYAEELDLGSFHL